MAATDAAGHFAMTLTSGEYAFTATADAGTAAYVPVRYLDADTKVDLALAAAGFSFTGAQKEYTQKTSAREWRAAREDARAVAQVVHKHDGLSGFNGRDAAMAENLGWILDHEARGAKIVVWAHNVHIAHAWNEPLFDTMGAHLARTYGKQYVAFGFLFEEGSFQAMDRSSRSPGPDELTLGPARDVDASVAFSRAGCEICVVDVRRAPCGAVADWFAATHLQRETDGGFEGEDAMTGPVELSKRYDAVIFVHKTTRTRPLKPDR